METSEGSHFLIFSDSKFVLQSLQGKDWKSTLTQRVLERHHRLRNQHNIAPFAFHFPMLVKGLIPRGSDGLIGCEGVPIGLGPGLLDGRLGNYEEPSGIGFTPAPIKHK